MFVEGKVNQQLRHRKTHAGYVKSLPGLVLRQPSHCTYDCSPDRVGIHVVSHILLH